jgi:hypothetical protein
VWVTSGGQGKKTMGNNLTARSLNKSTTNKLISEPENKEKINCKKTCKKLFASFFHDLENENEAKDVLRSRWDTPRCC